MSNTSLKAKIENRISELEELLKAGDYEKASLLLPNLTKFYSIFSEEQREFVSAARYAVDNNEEWK